MSITTGTFPGVRIADMPNLGAITDSSSFVGERAGSGRFAATAIRDYLFANPDFSYYVTVFDFGAVGDGVADDSDAIQAAFDYAKTGKRLHVPPPPFAYRITRPLVLLPGPDASGTDLRPPANVVFDTRANFLADAPMSAMLIIGASNYTDIIRSGLVEGGVWNCNNKANIGVKVMFADNLTLRSIQVRDWLTNAYEIGDNTSPSPSYGVLIETCLTTRIATAAAPVGSASILFKNATDCDAFNCTLTGGQIGIASDNSAQGAGLKLYDSKFTNVHVWNFVGNGELLYGFDLGGDNTLLGCQVDGPFLYAYHFTAPGNTCDGCNVNYTPASYGGIDNHASVFLLDAGAGVLAQGCSWKAQSNTERLKNECAGDQTNFRSKDNRIVNMLHFDLNRSMSEALFWTFFNGSGGSLGGHQVSSVARNGVGDYTISCSAPIPATGVLLATVSNADTTPLIAQEWTGNRTTFTIRVLCYNLAGAKTDPSQVSVAFFGIAATGSQL